jgi:hypothetical protein
MLPNREEDRRRRISPQELQRRSIGTARKANRADVEHLGPLRELVVPESWSDELSYSILPRHHASTSSSLQASKYDPSFVSSARDKPPSERRTVEGDAVKVIRHRQYGPPDLLQLREAEKPGETSHGA